MKRELIGAGLLVAMCTFGFGVYQLAGHLKGAIAHVQRPTATTAKRVPGVIYLSQGGAIYRFQGGMFRQITPDGGWVQPSASPDGARLVAVKRDLNSSDLYLLGTDGHNQAQLTHNVARRVEANHWAFYPRFGRNGTEVFFSYDTRDASDIYRDDLAIFAIALDPTSRAPIEWSTPNEYTGGDVNPVPLRGGGLIYTRFSIDDHSNVHSQVWLQARAGSPGVGLTLPADDCGQPAVSPDERWLAMVCRHGGLQGGDLVVAGLDPAGLGLVAPAVLVKGRLVASPSFSPDGQSVAYLAPDDGGGPFQLWTVAAPSSGAHATPVRITQDLDFDSSSSPVWLS